MKLTHLIPLAALAAATPAIALAQQPVATPSATQDFYRQRTNALLNGIMLDSKQAAKVDSIQAKYREQLPPMANQGQKPNDPYPSAGRPDSTQQSMMMMILERQDTEIRASLKSDQQKVWDKNKKDWNQRHTPVG